MEIIKALKNIKKDIPENVKLIAVSKTKPTEDILTVYNTGHKIFGENKVQELKEKYEILPKDIEWHMIGHLQTNKVKYIASFVSLIHSVDSLKLLKEINKRALQNNRIIDCLFEVHIAKEESKFGLDESKMIDILTSDDYKNLKNIRICGLMGIATNTDNQNTIRQEFKYLRELFLKTKKDYFTEKQHFKELSMGMTNDYKIAIEEGATIVRIGSAIFGKRIYH